MESPTPFAAQSAQQPTAQPTATVTELTPLPHYDYVVSAEAPALQGRVVRFYQEDCDLLHASYLAHTFFLADDKCASTVISKHTRFLREHFTPAYDGILDEEVTEGVEFVVIAKSEFHGRRFCMRTCASPRDQRRAIGELSCCCRASLSQAHSRSADDAPWCVARVPAD